MFKYVALIIALSSCGLPPYHGDVVSPPDGSVGDTEEVTTNTSALTPGTFCREATDPGGCLNGGSPIKSDQMTPNCPNSTGDYITIQLTQLISGAGVTWYDAIRTPARNNSEYRSTFAIEGTPVVGGRSYLPMSEGYGILYLSQNVAMTVRRLIDGIGMPVTILAGNLQYWPADATHPHGTWHMWVSSSGNDALGICGNFYVSWSPTS